MSEPNIVIHVDRLIKNYDQIKKKLGRSNLMVVVKANAYGHGSVECATALEKHGCKSFAVFSIFEGIELRNAGIKSDILIFSKLNTSYLDLALDHNLILNMSNLEDLYVIKRFSKQNENSPRFHVKFDTGMTRLGLNINEADDAFKILSQNYELKCEGIYSHFATADEGDLSFAYEQVGKFKEILNKANSFDLQFKTVHFSNSGAALNLDQGDFNLVRIGMLVYGAFPSNEVPRNIEVLPVMEFKAPIVEVRRVEKGTQISYGGVYKTKAKSNIGVVQCGFADGIPRSWYKNGFVGYEGKNYKIAGRICMDQFMVNFEDDLPNIGDEVLIFGSNDYNSISMETIAEEIDSTPYVIATGINGRTKRYFHN